MSKKSRGPGDFDPNATDLSLLGKTQQYLKQLLERRAPDSLLVAAWDEFYRVYDQMIRRFVVACHVPRSQVQDCVQEVWLAVAKHLADFEHPVVRPGLRAWLYRLVRSKAADIMRANRRLPRTMDVLPPQSVIDPSSFSVWEHILLDVVLEEIAAEEPTLRTQVFRLRFIDGRNTREVAEELRVGEHVVRYHYKKMLAIVQRRVSLYAGSAVTLVSSSAKDYNGTE